MDGAGSEDPPFTLSTSAAGKYRKVIQRSLKRCSSDSWLSCSFSGVHQAPTESYVSIGGFIMAKMVNFEI